MSDKFNESVREQIELRNKRGALAPEQETPRSASIQASGHEVPPGSLAESAQETPLCTCGSTHGDTHEDNCPMFPKRETPIRELAKQEAQQGTYFAIPVQETPASNYLDSEWGGDNDLPQTPAPAAFSDAEMLDWMIDKGIYRAKSESGSPISVVCDSSGADLADGDTPRIAISVAMRHAGLTPAATPERQDAMTALRSIEAMLGTLDHSEAVEEDCLVKHVTAKVAELVNRAATPPPSEDAKCLRRLAEAGEYYGLITPEWVAELRAIAGRIRGAATSDDLDVANTTIQYLCDLINELSQKAKEVPVRGAATPERDALIEQCAKIADEFDSIYTGPRLRIEGTAHAKRCIAESIRALKGGSHA